MSKFGGCYVQVEYLNVTGMNNKDTLENVLELFKTKVAKISYFLFLHYWWLLKDLLKWADRFNAKKINTHQAISTEVFEAKLDCVDMEGSGRGGLEATGSVHAGRTFKRPIGIHITKEQYKQGKLREFAIWAQTVIKDLQ